MFYMFSIPKPIALVERVVTRVSDAFDIAVQEYRESRDFRSDYIKPHVRKRTWTSGRANTGYETFSLAERGWWDCWIIRYPKGSHIPKHKDPPIVDFFRPTWLGQSKIFRLNIVLQPAQEGGEFRCERTIVKTRRVAFFRPDKHEHEVTPVHKGTRYVFSVGFAV